MFCLTDTKRPGANALPMGEKDKDEVKQTCIEKIFVQKTQRKSGYMLHPHPDTAKKFLIREFGKMSGNFVDINSKKVIGKHEGFYNIQ
jgi:tRNA U34 2-thiouridine synthase MnmA/TrmU